MQSIHMTLKFFGVAAAMGLLAACSTTDGGRDQTAADQDQDATAAPTTDVTQEEMGPEPGTPADFEETVGTDRVYFEFDSHTLDLTSRTTLQRQAAWLKRYPSYDVVIEGHCDERGTREYNLALGDRRATAVKNYLVALGISASRVDTISYGKERPVDPRSTEAAWAKNRRAVTVLETPPGV